MARHFCEGAAASNARPNATLTDDAIALLCEQPWRGNARELQNFVERLVVLGTKDAIDAGDVRRELGRRPLSVRSDAPPPDPDAESRGALDARRRETEREEIRNALERAGNNRSQAARLLGVSRRTLYNKLREHGIA